MKYKNKEIADYISEKIDGDDYDGGSAEACRKTADNAGVVIGNLINLLVEKNILSTAGTDMDEILKGIRGMW